MVKTNDADCEEAQVDESPEEMDCDDAADIYIMMQCLFVPFLFIPAPPPAPLPHPELLCLDET